MFDAQSLLGGLLKEAIGGRGIASKASLGVGAIGVAIAAYEHFTQEKEQMPSTLMSGTGAPPVPPSGASSNQSHGKPPPPPPSGTQSAPPMPPPQSSQEDRQALLLIDAMIAAANADGDIDAVEKSKIFKHLHSIHSDQEGIDYVQSRIESPPSLEAVCARVKDLDEAKQVYATSLLTITVDTVSEADYLKQLAISLQLDKPSVDEMHQQIQLNN
jgi:uncharacterized membrane protein YebE (DUF533 family)